MNHPHIWTALSPFVEKCTECGKCRKVSQPKTRRDNGVKSFVVSQKQAVKDNREKGW